MTLESSDVRSRAKRGGMFYTGWVLSLLPALFMLATAEWVWPIRR